MVDVHYHAALESPLPPGQGSVGDAELEPIRWQSLLAISGIGDRYYKQFSSENDRDVIHFFTFDLGNPNSILSTWKYARENARSIREQLASEMWESLNVSFLDLSAWDADRVLAGSPHEFFSKVKNDSHLFQGILNRTMLMGEARDWLDAGRFLERACQTARLLDVKYHDLLPIQADTDSNDDETVRIGSSAYGVGGALDTHGWNAVLKSVSALEMYRKTHRDGIHPANVVDFLVLCPQFPASVRHGIARVEGCLRRIRAVAGVEEGNNAERLIGRLLADLTYTRPDEIIADGLHEFLDGVQIRCAAIGSAIRETYLVY
jgi:uncharacterized alpha-E superfamily protein